MDRIKFFILAMAVVVLSACGGGGGPEPGSPTALAIQAMMENEKIYRNIVDDAPAQPDAATLAKFNANASIAQANHPEPYCVAWSTPTESARCKDAWNILKQPLPTPVVFPLKPIHYGYILG